MPACTQAEPPPPLALTHEVDASLEGTASGNQVINLRHKRNVQDLPFSCDFPAMLTPHNEPLLSVELPYQTLQYLLLLVAVVALACVCQGQMWPVEASLPKPLLGT
jgi:hypothetical protein